MDLLGILSLGALKRSRRQKIIELISNMAPKSQYLLSGPRKSWISVIPGVEGTEITAVLVLQAIA